MKYITPDDAVKDIVKKAKLLNHDPPADDILNLYAEKFVADVLDYCNREDFPAALTFTAAEMVNKWASNASNENDAPLKSIKHNDTEFQFAVDNMPSVGSSIESDFESIKSKLNMYRKLRYP